MGSSLGRKVRRENEEECISGLGRKVRRDLERRVRRGGGARSGLVDSLLPLPPSLPLVWKTGCVGENYRNEEALSSANAAVLNHLGERIGQLESNRLSDMVRWEGRGWGRVGVIIPLYVPTRQARETS
jgi:hypothetical protein